MSALRRFFVRAPAASRRDLRGRRMIVTGAASGSIGFATARTLAAWGADVVATTRGGAEVLAAALRAGLPADRGKIDVLPLDLAQADSVRTFADVYAARYGTLDVLVNNAGVHLDLLSQWRKPRRLDDGFEIHWRTNYLGPMQLTQRLLPLLLESGRSSGDARIVNLVSQLHARGRNAGLFAPLEPYDSWAAYGTSKLALVHASFELQRRHAGQGLQTYCLHPGAVFSNIAAHGLRGNPRIEALRRVFAPLEAFFLLTPEEGAQTSVYCATQPGLAGGAYFKGCRPAPASREAQDTEVSARLWQATQDWIDSLPA